MSIESLGETHAPCSLLLEVFEALSIYEDNSDTIAWEVSTDPAHPTPYLLAPRQYAEQEIDPILCTASIGTVEVGVIDVPTDSTDQQTGWMTARVHDILGRRCRLRRWIDNDFGWMTIADGPAGPPKLDASYAAYRWAIRDTRETERKLSAFNSGGVTGIVPLGPLYGFGRYGDDDSQILVPSLIESPVHGRYEVTTAGSLFLGLVNLSTNYLSGVGPTPLLIDEKLIVTEAGLSAIELSELFTDHWGARYADVIWRIPGVTAWSKARPISPTSFRQPFAGTSDATLLGGDPTVVVTALNYVTLFVDEVIPEGFPTEGGVTMEIIVRYRGPASEDFPYYVEGPLGYVLKRLYDGIYSVGNMDGIPDITTYDPAELDAAPSSGMAKILYDPDAFDALTERVILRQTSPVSDIRAFTETSLYAPTGWIPALDGQMRISPVSRNRPDDVDGSLLIDDAVVAPSPNWTKGERWISAVTYSYPRYFIPPLISAIEMMADGIAKRDIVITFDEPQAELRYGPQEETFDCSAFAAIGTSAGLNVPGQLEQSSLLAQIGKFELLDRYSDGGVQTIPLTVLRSRIPNVRVGDWVPWAVQYLPDRTFGLRGSEGPSAQIVSIRDDNCKWRTLVIEESAISAGPPGYVIALSRYDDEPSPGEVSLGVLTDEESY